MALPGEPHAEGRESTSRNDLVKSDSLRRPPLAAQDRANDDDVHRGDADPPANTPGGIDLEFRSDIEGLRAVAVVLVVLWHAGVSWLPGGFVGVDVFFVISGFLITGLLIREHEKRGRISIRGFYARRARRILPAAMVVVIATVLLAHHYFNVLVYPYTADDAKWAAWFAANIHFSNIRTDYFAQVNPSPLLHYWSLAVEEQFYVAWPAIVLLVGLVTGFLARRWPIRYTILAVAAVGSTASFVWAVHAVAVNSTWAFYSPFTRAWELGVGAILATVIVHAGRLPKWVGFAIAWGGVVAITWSAHFDMALNGAFPGAKTLLLPVLGAAAVIVGGASGIGAGHLLAIHPIRWIGRVSFGWYLLHYPPMILLSGSYNQNYPLPVHERLAIGAATLGIAFVMYYALERPIRRSRFLAARPWLSIGMGLMLVLAAFLVAVLYHKGF